MEFLLHYVTGMRKSDHDIFEINYMEDAGGVGEKKPVKKPENKTKEPEDI